MTQALINALSGVPAELATIILAATPIGELRLALPVALNTFNFSPVKAGLLSYVGNLIPIAVVFLALRPLVKFAEEKFPRVHRFMEKYFHALERKYQDRYDEYGLLLLLLFVAIPLPTSGAWTAGVVAVLFDVDWRYSVPAICGGLVIALMVVFSINQGVTFISG